jgi:hypothetical protein
MRRPGCAAVELGSERYRPSCRVGILAAVHENDPDGGTIDGARLRSSEVLVRC